MIIIITPKNGHILYYPSLKSACKYEKWMSYGYLTHKKLYDTKPLEYKGFWLYRIAHSML